MSGGDRGPVTNRRPFMRKLILPMLLAGSAALAGCMTAAPPPDAYAACGAYGYVDRDNDGWLEADEWNAYRAGAYSYWDKDRDGRISQREFQDCWYGGAFYRADWSNRDYWNHYWSALDRKSTRLNS